jgi:hypothetical protein
MANEERKNTFNMTPAGAKFWDNQRQQQARDAANSPTAKRIVEAGRQFVRDPLNIESAARAVKARKKGKQGRSSSGRQ